MHHLIHGGQLLIVSRLFNVDFYLFRHSGIADNNSLNGNIVVGKCTVNEQAVPGELPRRRSKLKLFVAEWQIGTITEMPFHIDVVVSAFL